MPSSAQLAERIRKALDAAKVSQSALARYCGVSRQLVSLWVHADEHTRTQPSDEHMKMIAKRLGTTVEWLEGVKLNDAPEMLIGEARNRYEHGANSRWREELKESVASRNPKLVSSFNYALRMPYVEEQWAFDYVTPEVAAQLVGHRLNDRGFVREQLWKLACLRAVDERLGFKRDYVLALAAKPDSEYAVKLEREAALLGLRVECSESGRTVGDALAKNEPEAPTPPRKR